MPRLLNHVEIAEAVERGSFIKGGKSESAEGVKYDFHLSNRILKAGFGRPIDAEKLSEIEKKDLYIEPGEMVFVLTEERLTLPDNMVALLSPKRKLSHAGILSIGGFCIDPLYDGKLLVGLYNFSSTRFPIIPGKKLIAANFYQLNKEEKNGFSKPEAAVDDFPDELVAVMQNYRPVMMQPVLVRSFCRNFTRLHDHAQ